jgi:hypothetical protein
MQSLSAGLHDRLCTDAAASDLDKARADIASIEVKLTATRSQLTKALDALGA